MKISDLSTFFDEPIRTLSTSESLDGLLVGSEVSLYPSLQDKELLLQQGDVVIGFDLTESDAWVVNSSDWLWLLRSLKNNTISLQGLKVSAVMESFAENLNVAVDEKIRHEVASKAGFLNPSIEKVTDWLREEFVLEGSGKERIFQASHLGNEDREGVTLVGRNFQLTLEITANKALWIRRFSPHSRNRNYSLAVVESGINFLDGTIAAHLANPEEVQKLQELRSDNSSYIALWEKYDRIADRKAQEQARKIGYVSYVKHEQEATVDGVEWRFYFNKDSLGKVNDFVEELKMSDGANLEIDKALPSWLTNQPSTGFKSPDEYQPRLTATLVRKTNSYLVLNLGRGSRPTSKGFIYSSMAGTETSSKRRRMARDNINTQQNAMPQLCHLIEGLPVKIPRYRSIKTMSGSARASFRGDPTVKQIDALDVALNTPDIALILGPPGTGKTQIISALQRRLAEEAKSDIGREVLVSSFQHDAVDNVVARSDVFGLPAIRVGKRERGAAILQQWISKQQTMVEKVLNEEKLNNDCYQLIERIRRDIALLLNSGMAENEFLLTLSNLTRSLESLGSEHHLKIPSTLHAKLSVASEKVSQKADVSVTKIDNGLLRVVRSLRVTVGSFADDGVYRAYECLYALEQSKQNFQEEDLEILRSMSEYYESPNESSLKQLSSVRTRLIEALMPDYRPRKIRTKLNPELEGILKDISSDLTGQLASEVAGIVDVLSEYQQTLAYQKGRVRKTVEDYTTTLGATCQGAVSTEMLNTLSAAGEANISFDTVIVDEAARANPLDLFIPMSLSKRRIVLVGDHYQLPQILEPEIEEEMRETGSLSDEFSNSLKDSLFERLYVQLRDREKEDGVRRTVMLDTQFRMHPDIGKFVSKQFYESNGEPELKSGLDESHFAIEVPGFDDAIMHWVDVPGAEGNEKRSGSSWVRYIEAERVADIAAKIVQNCPDISVGVITFYAKQREAIFAALEVKDICRKTDEGWEYEPAFVSTKDGEERIRVGSVDAFQGKEFDVVLLSMTRSNKYSGLEEAQLNRKFGFLRLPNRLNVAFSRAKKRLIVIGDRKMFSSLEAKAAIPSVYEYSVSLCGDSK